jgi:hypothetical protein
MINSEDEFLFSKRDFVLNCLTLGVALEIISRNGRCSRQTCLNSLVNLAEARMARQTPESIERLIEEYFIAQQNKVKSILVDSPKTA